ncbi:sensor histidine kinase [Wenxinia saemankumensis]|uniref:histidine kinase n=1 Tax=Wenxinia saemankumensis TaxID=1447782 RepID=A0A1M6A5E0_9RHOB|nr:ATP-binding protein [Wenxinia saemankumensis]SHI31647.1 two-component system, OmpR family, phosphate regulon sensor histidine kinase PhoR [Wenxinia saemankumensis]
MTTPAHLLSALPIPALLIGADERVAALNPAAAALLPNAGEGRHYITALRQPPVLDGIEAALRGGDSARGRYLGHGPGGDTVWAFTAARVGPGPAAPVLVSFEDTTELENAGRMRRDFVANVSHELRTPLTALLGFVETLKGAAKRDPAATERFLGLMEREATRMSRLVADLLSLSRLEKDERVRPVAPVALRGLIRATLESLDHVAGAEAVTLVTDLPEEEIRIPGDEGQLGQVIANLVENAIKYGGRGGTVTVRLTAPAPEPALRVPGVRLEVSDTGPGIAAHHIPRLTERFYRVDNHRSREVGGTGLGLAIVKHIVSRHRGRLRVESAPGQGTTFTAILPAS